MGFALYYASSGSYVAGDFHHTFLLVGWRELHGGDPYAWTRAQVAAQLSFPYPALTVVLLEPFAAIPSGVAAGLYLILCAGAIFGTLRLLGVRDWRIYGAVALWSPVLIGWQTGNFTLPLVFGVAVVWRYRDRPWLVGLAVALLVSIKPIMFPVAVWLVVTRRYAATLWAACLGVAFNAVAWTLIGWNELSRWLHLVSVQSAVMYRDGYGIIALLARVGVNRTGATAVVAVISVAGCVACYRLAKNRQERAAFILAVGLMLVCSPKIDQHYFAFLVVALALVQPRLSGLWLAPLLVWLCPATDAAEWQILGWWLVAGVLVWRAAQSAYERSEPSMPPGTVRAGPAPADYRPGVVA